jgi:nifR3 family TIM-barrel protein
MGEKNIHPIQIEDLKIPNNLWLAPMAGFSNQALRVFTKSFGAGLAFTEMVSVEGLIRLNKKTLEYIHLEEEGMAVVQLFGKNEPKKFYQAAQILRERAGAKIVDINFGCPVRKVVHNEAGSYFLKVPQTMGDVIKALKDAGLMVSAKIRSGFDRINIEETIPVLSEAGADIITLHPRLAIQFYRGKADWELFRKAREMTKAVLIGSGDVESPEDAERLFADFGVDGVMIGRRAVGAPYIFSQILDYFTTGQYHSYSITEIKALMIKFAEVYVNLTHKDSIIPIRGSLIQYYKNVPHANPLRQAISSAKTIIDLKTILENF